MHLVKSNFKTCPVKSKVLPSCAVLNKTSYVLLCCQWMSLWIYCFRNTQLVWV